jgi:hypothetical protein
MARSAISQRYDCLGQFIAFTLIGVIHDALDDLGFLARLPDSEFTVQRPSQEPHYDVLAK